MLLQRSLLSAETNFAIPGNEWIKLRNSAGECIADLGKSGNNVGFPIEVCARNVGYSDVDSKPERRTGMNAASVSIPPRSEAMGNVRANNSGANNSDQCDEYCALYISLPFRFLIIYSTIHESRKIRPWGGLPPPGLKTPNAPLSGAKRPTQADG